MTEKTIYMTPADLQAWQEKMGLTAPKAAAALGVSYSGTYRDYLSGVSRNTGKPVHISKAVALACSALAAGLDVDSWRR